MIQVCKGKRLKTPPSLSFVFVWGFLGWGCGGWMLVYHLISLSFQVFISMLTTIHWSSAAFYPETFRSSAKVEEPQHPKTKHLFSTTTSPFH